MQHPVSDSSVQRSRTYNHEVVDYDRIIERASARQWRQPAVSNRWRMPPLLLTAHSTPGVAASEFSDGAVASARIYR
jgi:hypothetical protein